MAQYKVIYDIDVSDPGYMPESPQLDGLQVIMPCTLLTREEFYDEWLGVVVRATIDYLPIYTSFDGVPMWLGRFNSDQSQVAVLGKEMDGYGTNEITYNGYYVTVTGREVNWGVA